MLYDPFGIDVHRDPYAVYRVLRDEHPVYHNPARGFWALSRFDDVQAAARDWETFSNAAGVSPGDYAHFFGEGDLLEADPPEHTRLRGLLRHRFSAASLKSMEGSIRSHTEQLIESLLDSSAPDLALGLARPLPARVVTDLLGLPTADSESLFDLFEQMMYRPPGEEHPSAAARAALKTMQEYLLAEVALRHKGQGDDLLSDIAAGELAGTIRPQEVAGICTLLVVAGLETTSNLIGSSLRLIADNPQQRALLIGDPSLLPRAVEECLRFESPLQFHARKTTRDVQLHHSWIPADEWILLLFGSANRDERRFSDPDQFDILREVTRHLAFGDGIHHCVGAPLARLEARIALGLVLERAPNYELLGKPSQYESHFIRGITRLPSTMNVANYGG